MPRALKYRHCLLNFKYLLIPLNIFAQVIKDQGVFRLLCDMFSHLKKKIALFLNILKRLYFVKMKYMYVLVYSYF